MIRLVYYIALTITLISCTQSQSNYTFFSTDPTKLGQVINLKEYKPTKVKFKYVALDSSNDGRTSVPGPSDYRVEAVLYFDSLTFDKLLRKYSFSGIMPPKHERVYFTFEWLDNNIKNEINLAKKDYFGVTGFSFDSSGNSSIMFLDKKLLLIKFSN